MKHLAFYYAIGFSVMGVLLSVALFPMIVGALLTGSDPYAVTALSAAMFLPFVIGVLSWRDWKQVQRKQTPELTERTVVGMEGQEQIEQKPSGKHHAGHAE